MDKLLLRVNEVAEVLGIARSKAYELTQRGGLPGVIRIGKSVRVSREALEGWVREQAASSTTDGRNRRCRECGAVYLR